MSKIAKTSVSRRYGICCKQLGFSILFKKVFPIWTRHHFPTKSLRGKKETKHANVSSQTAAMDLKFLLVTTLLVGMAQSSLSPPEELVELCRFMDCDATLERQG